MKRASTFPDHLDFRLSDHRNGSAVFRLAHYYRYTHPDHPIITVPTGFYTDGASIPRPFWNIMGPHGPYFRAAVIHDFLYSLKSDHHFHGIDRAEADEIFLSAMTDCGVSWITRHTIYHAVRMFGWACYKKS